MRTKNLLCIALAAALSVATSIFAEASADTAFTYQGRLLENGSPLTGTVRDLRFTLWDDPFGGSQIAAAALEMTQRIAASERAVESLMHTRKDH